MIFQFLEPDMYRFKYDGAVNLQYYEINEFGYDILSEDSVYEKDGKLLCNGSNTLSDYRVGVWEDINWEWLECNSGDYVILRNSPLSYGILFVKKQMLILLIIFLVREMISIEMQKVNKKLYYIGV